MFKNFIQKFKKGMLSINLKSNSSSSLTFHSGTMITDLCEGKNLVNGKVTWELAKDEKHNIEMMRHCCDAEIEQMNRGDIVPAPYYFHRVAILSKKQKDYKQEICYCEKYIEIVENFYKKNGTKGFADVRKGPVFER